MADPHLISIVGHKDAGKTTLLVAMARTFVRQGLKVATLKHGHHPAAADREGKDTWRHFNEAGAEQVLIESPGARVLFERPEEQSDPFTLARTYLAGADFIFVEGFKGFPLPKIEAHRQGLGKPPLAARPDDYPGTFVALVTDDRETKVACPVFRFTDTSWLQALLGIARNSAMRLSDAP